MTREAKIAKYEAELPQLEARLERCKNCFVKQSLRQKIRVRREFLGLAPKTIGEPPKRKYTPRGTKIPMADNQWHFEWPEDCSPICSVPHDGVTPHFGSVKFNVTDNWQYVNCPKCLALRQTFEADPDKLRGKFFELFRREAK